MILKSCISLMVFPLLLLSCVKSGHSRDLNLGEHHIVISGFTEEQLHRLESTLLQLKSLKPMRLKIKKQTYQRLSRFEALFGFTFDGERLSDWLLIRIRTISYGNPWTVAVNQNQGTFVIGVDFFSRLNDLERLYLFIHEARHSDGDGYKHTKCPKGFPFISAGQPEQDLENAFACDNIDDGAYAFQAAFLFELFAYGLFDQREVGLLYNSSISRVFKNL